VLEAIPARPRAVSLAVKLEERITMAMHRARGAALAILGLVSIGVPAALARTGGTQIPGTNFAVSADDSGGDLGPVAQCSLDGYRLSFTNNSGSTLTVSKLSDRLYPGFSYVPGSATITDANSGTVTPVNDPDISGTGKGGFLLEWPHLASDVWNNQTVYLHFNVMVLDRTDPIVLNAKKLSYPSHGELTLTTGQAVNQNTSIRVSKTSSLC
jgi:uncharacterized repeat protein (TIGR01451 family)